MFKLMSDMLRLKRMQDLPWRLISRVECVRVVVVRSLLSMLFSMQNLHNLKLHMYFLRLRFWAVSDQMQGRHLSILLVTTRNTPVKIGHHLRQDLENTDWVDQKEWGAVHVDGQEKVDGCSWGVVLKSDYYIKYWRWLESHHFRIDRLSRGKNIKPEIIAEHIVDPKYRWSVLFRHRDPMHKHNCMFVRSYQK